MAAKADDKDLFPMRIASPPRELTGEHLANQVPRDWNSKGSIYADQFLQHLAPPDLDEEQRRQFFCILDLRRLKYAADEIFANKAWKLNIINFAKEFEKSRSIILLRYGLYEFQNVKPSREVLKRWRREHGLPEPEEEEAPAAATPSKSASSKKRKADGDLTADTGKTEKQSSLGKRRATERGPEPEPIPDTSKVLGKTKRRASMDNEDDDQPSKRSTPSATKSLFEKIANNSTASPAPKAAEAAKKPSIFGASKPAAGGLARSVFENLKSGPGAAPAAAGGNIFGYLSDASSAKNSGVDADADSDTDSEADDSAEAGQSDEPSGNASATAETASQVGSTLFGNKPAAVGVDAGGSSEPGTRESTPGRSLFDRVTKDDDGEPVRASEEPAEKPAADQTWNPSTTPLKFAPTASSSSIFGKPATSGSTSSIFAPKPASSSSLFGAPKQDTLAKETPTVSESEKEVGESDKENDSQPSQKPAFEPKTTVPAQPSFGSLFQPKPATPASTEAETSKPAASNLFGAAKPATSNLFGAASKPAESTPVMQSSTLFGAKPSESKPAEAEVTKPSTTEAAPATTESKPASSLFASQPAASGSASSLFGGASKPATANLFGNSNASAASTAPKTDAAPAAAPAPTFSFGGASSATASKPLFGAPKSPPASTAPSNMFAGSPMKQDDQSPAKKMFTGSATNGASTPLFSFGGAATTTPAPAPTFGGTVNTANTAATTNNAAISFGSETSTATNGGSFGFNFGGSSTGTSFNNPFASGGASTNGAAAAPPATSGGMFNFGGAAPAASSGGSFQFGGAGGSAPASGGNIFGNQNAAAAAPVFGGASNNSGNSTGFNFTSAPAQGNGAVFGGNQPTPLAPSFGNSLQPPAGGSSTTGTSKSTFANRKIAPLKRRL